MARRAFVPPPTLSPDSAPRGGGGPPPSRSPSQLGLRQSVPPPASVPPQRASVPPPPGSGSLPDSRRSVPPPSLPGTDGVSIASCSQLLDRLAAADEAPFIAAWIETVLSGRTRTDPTLAVRLLRAYRETGRVDRARDLAASLPERAGVVEPARRARASPSSAPSSRPSTGAATTPRPSFACASRALSAAPKGTGLREQLDMHLTQAQLELRLNRVAERVAGAAPRRARRRAARGRRVARAGRDDARATCRCAWPIRGRPPSTTPPRSRARPRAAPRR